MLFVTKARAGKIHLFLPILSPQPHSSFVIGTLPCKAVKGRVLHRKPPHCWGTRSVFAFVSRSCLHRSLPARTRTWDLFRSCCNALSWEIIVRFVENSEDFVHSIRGFCLAFTHWPRLGNLKTHLRLLVSHHAGRRRWSCDQSGRCREWSRWQK